MKLFPTSKKEAFRTRGFRLIMNVYPMFFGTGGKVRFISSDWKEVHISMRLSLWTRNYVGTLFGGSLFSATDPFYPLMLFHVLGKNYVVWDKSASIRFKKPAKKTVYCKFLLNEEIIALIKQKVLENGEVEQSFQMEWIDKSGMVYTQLDRVIYIAEKKFYKEKKEGKEGLR